MIASAPSTLQDLVRERVPEGKPAKIYVWKWPQDALLDLTCCLPMGACATVTFPDSLLREIEGLPELERRVDELVTKCLERLSGE